MLRTIWDSFTGWIRDSVDSGAVDRTGSLTEQERAFIKSYVWLRIVVGVVGWSLPVVLWLGDWWFVRVSAHARGSISAYYHSPMRDWFVAALCVIGALLVTYMLGKWQNFEFWVSTIAGLGLIGVAFFPTERSDITAGTPSCGSDPIPRDCNDLEHRFGEQFIGNLHIGFAITALVLLGVLALLFAARARRRDPGGWLGRIQLACAGVIALALLVAAAGMAFTSWQIWVLTPLYVGEVLTVLAFGTSWFLQGLDLNRWLKTVPDDGPAEETVVTAGAGSPPGGSSVEIA